MEGPTLYTPTTFYDRRNLAHEAHCTVLLDMQKEYARPQRRLSATEEASLKQSTRTSYEKAGKLKVLLKGDTRSKSKSKRQMTN
jgi:hypothetical protein